MFDEENAVIKSLQKGERSNRNGKSGKKKVESKSVKKKYSPTFALVDSSSECTAIARVALNC